MKAEAGRTLVLLSLTLVGFLLWPPSRISLAIGCWVLGAVYALATNPRRWL
jgi:hypothetical protein